MIQEKDKYRLLIENLPDGLAYCKMVRDSTGKPVDYIFLEVNSSFEALTGLPRDHIIGKKLTEVRPGVEDLSFDWIGVFEQVTAIEPGQNIRLQQYLDQRERWHEITVYSDQPDYFAAVFHDITERKQTEERERHFKQVLLAIRKVNQLIVQETDPERLIDQACQILTKTLGYYNVWIALLDEGGKVTSTAASGFDDGYNLFEEQLKQGKYPLCIKKAFQEKGAIVIDSALDSCSDCPLYSGHVGRAGLFGRIQYGDKLYGMLSASIPREYANLEETSKLFIELAGDLGLALYKIALEEESKQAELIILIQRDLALAISFSHELDEALPRCLDAMLQLSEMDYGGIYLIDQASGDLNLICHRNFSPAFIKSVSHYKADSTRARLVLQGKPLFTRYSELDLPLNQDELAEKLRAFAILPLIFENRVIGCLNLASKKLEDVSEINRQVLKTAATLMGEGITRLKIEEELKLSYQKLQKAIKSTIQAIALILEKRDPYTAGHQKRVTKLACTIAEEISLSPDKIERLYMAGALHDVGKINVPTEILSKPVRLSEIELSLIKTHPQVGSDILKEMELPGEVSSIVLQHHERMDGSGYPSGLSGEAILLGARILAVADVVEAMSSHRPYRPALGLDKALEEITKNKGKLYDPEVVDVCLKLFKKKGFKFE